MGLPEAEQTTKKRRKKKKKSKPGFEDVEQETHNMALKRQEPPKFEVSNLIIISCI